MSPNPQHGTPAGDATIALRKHARQTGGDVQELMTLYALEGLLSRIAISEYRDDFVLKGGVLLAAFAARRPTKDIDLQATRLTDDPDDVAERVRTIARLEPRRSSQLSIVASPTLAGATSLTSTPSSTSTRSMEGNSAHRSRPSPTTAKLPLHRANTRARSSPGAPGNRWIRVVE